MNWSGLEAFQRGSCGAADHRNAVAGGNARVLGWSLAQPTVGALDLDDQKCGIRTLLDFLDGEPDPGAALLGHHEFHDEPESSQLLVGGMATGRILGAG